MEFSRELFSARSFVNSKGAKFAVFRDINSLRYHRFVSEDITLINLQFFRAERRKLSRCNSLSCPPDCSEIGSYQLEQLCYQDNLKAVAIIMHENSGKLAFLCCFFFCLIVYLAISKVKLSARIRH